MKDTTQSSKIDGISAGLCPLFKESIGTISKVLSPLNYEVTFEDGSVKSPLHIQFLRRYFIRTPVEPKPSIEARPTKPASYAQLSDLIINPSIDTNDNHQDRLDDILLREDTELFLSDRFQILQEQRSEHGGTVSTSSHSPPPALPSAPIEPAYEQDDDQTSSSSQISLRKSRRLAMKPLVDYKSRASRGRKQR